MRMAMSCLGLPVLGRPTRRARFSSAPVVSGMSEKSIHLSGICSTLFAARLPRADDANRFGAIFRPPQGVDNQKNTTLRRHAESFPPAFGVHMFQVFPV